MLLLLAWRVIYVLGLCTGSKWVHTNWSAILHPKHNVHPIFPLWVNTMFLNTSPNWIWHFLTVTFHPQFWVQAILLLDYSSMRAWDSPGHATTRSYRMSTMRSPDVGSMANRAVNKCKGHDCKFSEAFFLCEISQNVN